MLKPSIILPCYQKCPIIPRNMPNDRSGNCKENPDVQIPKSTLKTIDLNSSLNGVPHWMTETLAGSALMKEASKCSETLQEYRSGYENPVGEVSDSDLKQISLDLSFTELQASPMAPRRPNL
jgi:hypothetical protein